MLDRLHRLLSKPSQRVPDLQLIAKATVAAAAAWWLARVLPGHAEPYFASLAALLGVYPTVPRSLRESARYALGFLLGALLGVPVALLLGPTVWGIIAVVPATLLVASWRKLAGQGIQVPFTALFVLLASGGKPVAFTVPRLVDVAIGVVTGLLVNAAVPPALRRQEAAQAVYRLGCRTAELLQDTAEEIRQGQFFGAAHRTQRALAVHQTTFEVAEAQATAAESHRLNPRSRLSRARDPRPARTALEALYAAAEQSRVITRAARRVGGDCEPSLLGVRFREQFADLLDLLADLVADCGRSGQSPPQEKLEEAKACYRAMRATVMEPPDQEWDRDPQRRLAETQLCALGLQLLFELVPEDIGTLTPEELGLSR